MKRETALSIFLIGASAGAGYVLRKRFGFDPLAYAEHLGLSPQGAIVFLAMAMLTVLATSLSSQDEPPYLILGDLKPTESERAAVPSKEPASAAREASSPDEPVPPNAIDPSGEWPQPRGPYQKAEDHK